MYRSDCAQSQQCEDGKCVARSTPLPARDAGAADSGNSSTDAGLGADAADLFKNVSIEGGRRYCSIGEALAAATSGAVIRVPAGRYEEHLVVATDVVIRGAGSQGDQRTEIVATGTVAALRLSGAGVVVESILVTAASAEAIFIDGKAALRSMHVGPAAGAAVRVGPTATATLTHVEIRQIRAAGAGGEDDGVGLSAGAGARAMLTDGRIEGCAGAGILGRGATLDVRGTDVTGNAAGVVAEGAGIVRLSRGVKVDGNQGAGVVVRGGRLEMTQASCADNAGGDGLRLAGGASATVQGNSFFRNGGFGMFCDAGVTLTLCMGNMLSGNASGPTNCQGCN